MKVHFKVFIELFKLALKRYLENRWNTLGSVFISAATILITVFFVNVLFNFTDNIHGWGKYEAIFLVGMYRIFITVFSLLFLRSINFIHRVVRDGDLDILLSKPVSSQFMVSFRLIRAFEIFNIPIGVVIVIYALTNMGYSGDISMWLMLILGLILGELILYGLLFSIGTLAVWLGNFQSGGSLNRIITEPLQTPMDFLGKTLSIFLTFVIPLGFMVAVPVGIFIGKDPTYYLLFSFIFATVCLGFSIWFWNFALKHYTSASS